MDLVARRANDGEFASDMSFYVGNFCWDDGMILPTCLVDRKRDYAFDVNEISVVQRGRSRLILITNM